MLKKHIMKRLEEFRKYYNHTIHPELLRMERNRIRLLRLMLFSAVLFAGLIFIQFYINIPVVAFMMMIPMGFYIAYLGYRISKFIQDFKPRIMDLILDFIDDGLNFGTLQYDQKKFIPKEDFLQSNIFVTSAHYYRGEDHISGKIGEMDFELCELNVREISPVSNRLEYVFTGIFLHATFNEETEGAMVLWPRKLRQFHTRAIKEFTWDGGVNVDHEILNPEFREHFTVYASEDTHVAGILSEPMQEAIIRYIQQTGKEIYLSFIDQEIFAAISEPKDILEPYLLRSNLSFELVHEFFEDIHLVLSIISDFDQNH